jgi:hypothetical protein
MGFPLDESEFGQAKKSRWRDVSDGSSPMAGTHVNRPLSCADARLLKVLRKVQVFATAPSR